MSIKDSNNMLSSYLIEKVDIDLNFRDKNGKNALMYSSEIGNYNIVDLLVKKNADPNLIDKVELNSFF